MAANLYFETARSTKAPRRFLTATLSLATNAFPQYTFS